MLLTEVVQMEEQRQYSRSSCYSMCLLLVHDGNTFEGLMGDISKSGALVKTISDTHLHVGDFCDIMFSNKSTVFPAKRPIEIVRLNSAKVIGVKFLT